LTILIDISALLMKRCLILLIKGTTWWSIPFQLSTDEMNSYQTSIFDSLLTSSLSSWGMSLSKLTTKNSEKNVFTFKDLACWFFLSTRT